MKTVAWIFIGFAAIWGLAPYETINEPARILIDILDWPIGDAPAKITRSQMWLSSIGAGLIVAVSIIMLGIIVPALRNSNKPIIKTTIYAFTAWFVIDSAGSIAAGVMSNALFNTLFFALVLIPLVMIRTEENNT